MLLSAKQSVMVVIDMQDVFLRPIKVRKMLEQNIGFLMEIASLLSVPRLATVQNQEHFGEMVASLQAKGEITTIDKLCFSAVQIEPFILELHSLGRPQILLTGVEAHICVLQTALDLLRAGYRVFAPYDAIGSRTKDDWKFAVRRLEQAGVIVNSVESAAYEWLESAGTDEFRKVLPLLKRRYQSAEIEDEDEEEDEESEE